MNKVIKRNGDRVLFNINKIQKYTNTACNGLENVSSSELELDASKHFYDGIKTSEIQKILIQTAIDKISIENPNWSFVAARLFLNDLYHQVNKNNTYPSLKEYLLNAIKCGKIVNDFVEKYDLDKLNEYIDINRDLNFNYIGIKTLHDRYLLKNDSNELIELPQHMFMCISMFLAQNEVNPLEWAVRFYDILSKFEFMVATPTLANARTPRHQLSSCFVGSMNDSIEGIFDAYKTMALLSKNGGGIGWDFSNIRALGSNIDKNTGAAGGVIPFLKIANDISIAVDQLGTRKGAIAAYLEIWHPEVIDFIDLRKNSGDERRRAHDLFPALWVCDLFMKRVKNNEEWSFLDPLKCSNLTNLYDEEFENKYIEYEKKYTSTPYCIKINAKNLWIKILTNCFENGVPFICFKDTANRCNPNKHNGIIRSSNLCTEIFQNTEPANYYTKLVYENESVEYSNNDIIKLDNKNYKKPNKITSLDKINNKNCYVNIQQMDLESEKIAVCNLGSINLSKINTKEDIERVVPIAIRMLDNVIDLNMYPVYTARKCNNSTRAIGLGIMGEAEMLASNSIEWGSDKHLDKVNEIMENISYNAILASSNLALEKGSYECFQSSDWQKGLLPVDRMDKSKQKFTCNWDALRYQVTENGLRNGYLLAIAPTSNISILTGTTPSIEPIYKKMWYEENLSGLIPVVVPNLNKQTNKYYKSAYDIDMMKLVKIAAARQKWIDQGQSLNLFIPIDTADGKYINDIYMLAWELGLKSIYYLRSESPSTCSINKTNDCMVCQ